MSYTFYATTADASRQITSNSVTCSFTVRNSFYARVWHLLSMLQPLLLMPLIEFTL